MLPLHITTLDLQNLCKMHVAVPFACRLKDSASWHRQPAFISSSRVCLSWLLLALIGELVGDKPAAAE